VSDAFRSGRKRTAVALAAFFAWGAGLPVGASAQAQVKEFVVTGGVAWEFFDGNFSAVTLPVVDSTEHAIAAVGEFGARTQLRLLDRPGSSLLDVTVDGGLRQFAALGFQLRDYAPREYVARVAADYAHVVGDVGLLALRASYRGRAVEDRPPMPLFLQPGYGSFRSSGSFQLRPIQGVNLDAEVDVERTRYEAPPRLPQVSLLDRRAQGVELGALTRGGEQWSVRFFSGVRWSRYDRQATSDPVDPVRRDHTVNVGARWQLRAEDAVAGLGIEGIVNRSNSRRPEYDALSVRAELVTRLPLWDLSTNVLALLTWKTYVHETSFARLVPGEEADNASVIYVDLIRGLAPNLDGVLRFGWTRAETDIGNSYYRRFGTTVLMNFRPTLF